MGPKYQPAGNPFNGRTLYPSDDLQAAHWAKTHRATSWLRPIIDTPQGRWINSQHDFPALRRAGQRAAAKRQLLVVVAYAIPNRGCDNNRQGAPNARAYEQYVRGLAAALTDAPAVVVLEPDAVAADCWTKARASSLRYATEQLERAGHHVYIDAGHAGWRSSGFMADRLVKAGITEASGLAINVAARDTVGQAQKYGEELSDLVGARPYIIDTSRNGLGPAPDDGEQTSWCNPPKQALGAPPNTRKRLHNIAQIWIKNPGESDGSGPTCGGETAYPGLFSPRQAHTLIAGATWVPPAQRRALPDLEVLPWTK